MISTQQLKDQLNRMSDIAKEKGSPYIDATFECDVYNDLTKSDNVFIPKFFKVSHMILSKYKDHYNTIPALRTANLMSDVVTDGCYLANRTDSIRFLQEVASKIPEYYAYLLIVAAYFRNKMIFLSSCAKCNDATSDLIFRDEYIKSDKYLEIWPDFAFMTSDKEWSVANYESKLMTSKATEHIFSGEILESNITELYYFMSSRFHDVADIGDKAYFSYRTKLNSVNSSIVTDLNTLYGEMNRPDYFIKPSQLLNIANFRVEAVKYYDNLLDNLSGG